MQSDHRGIAKDEEEPEQWLRYTGEALALHTLARNGLGIGVSLTTLGEESARLAQYRTSKALISGAVETLDSSGHQLNAAIARSQLALTLALLGDAEQAVVVAEEMVAQLFAVIDTAGELSERAAALKYRVPQHDNYTRSQP